MLSFKSRKVEQNSSPAQQGQLAPSRMISNSEMIDLLAAENVLNKNEIEKTSENLIAMLRSISDTEERNKKVKELKSMLELLMLETN